MPGKFLNLDKEAGFSKKAELLTLVITTNLCTKKMVAARLRACVKQRNLKVAATLLYQSILIVQG